LGKGRRRNYVEAIIIGIILGGFQLLMGLVLKNFSDSLKDLKQQDLALTKELTDVKINYVHKQDLKDFKEEIFEKFTELKQYIKEELKDK
jgi:hypothetical protein